MDSNIGTFEGTNCIAVRYVSIVYSVGSGDVVAKKLRNGNGAKVTSQVEF